MQTNVRMQQLGVLQRPPTPILLQKYRDTTGRRIAIEIGAYTTSAKRRACFCKSVAVEMRGVSSGVDVTLLKQEPNRCSKSGQIHPCQLQIAAFFRSHITYCNVSCGFCRKSQSDKEIRCISRVPEKLLLFENPATVLWPLLKKVHENRTAPFQTSNWKREKGPHPKRSVLLL